MAMTPRERVKAALRHEPPDRLPRYEIFLPAFKDRWRDERGQGEEATPYDEYTEIDIGTRLANQNGPFTSRVREEPLEGDDYLRYDSWGRTLRCSRRGALFEVLETPLQDKGDPEALVFEDPWTPEAVDRFRKAAAEIEPRFVPVSGVMGLFMPSYYLRGEFELLIDLKEDPAYCRALADRLADFNGASGLDGLAATNSWDTAIWVFDELGTNHGSLIGPTTFEEVYLEPYTRMIGQWKEHGATHVILHCDGNCEDLLDLLIAAGFTGLQGAYPTTGMNIPALKRRYGSRFSYIGGMCNVEDLRRGDARAMARQIDALAEAGADGGVIVGHHSVDDDIPVAHYDLYDSLLRERVADAGCPCQ